MSVFILLLFSLLPVEQEIVTEVNLIEINHFYDERGRLTFDQMIFWDNNIRDWRLIKEGRKKYSEEELAIKDKEEVTKFLQESGLKEIPEGLDIKFLPEYIGDSKFCFTYEGNKKILIFQEDSVIVKIYYTTIAETHTQYDPELVNREILPKEQRDVLIKPRATNPLYKKKR